ncbi:MAG TPA: sulfurtransferase TusA family protein [Actinomycetota bacterium]
MTTTDVVKTIDARGKPCPGPLMALIGEIRRAGIGSALEVWSNDSGSRIDIPAWIEKARHELISVTDMDGYTSFVVRKAR